MGERAEREPTMEEIVVALRETRRGADRTQPFPIGNRPRSQRALPNIGSTDLVDLRDNEIERLLAENSRLNARVVSLLKVIEQEQARQAETTPNAADREAIYNAVRAALEAELTPILLVLLRLIERHRPEIPETASRPPQAVALSPASEAGPSDWIIDLMHRLEARAPAPNETVADADAMPRRSKLRDRMTEVLNAFRLEPYGPPPRRPQSPSEPHA